MFRNVFRGRQPIEPPPIPAPEAVVPVPLNTNEAALRTAEQQGISWPGTVLVTVGMAYSYLLIRHGIDPADAVKITTATQVPLVAMVLPLSSIGTWSRNVIRFVGHKMVGDQ